MIVIPRIIGSKFDVIVEQVGKCLSHAPTEELEALAEMIDEYASRYRRTWEGIREQPAARKLLDVIKAEANLMPVARTIGE